MSSAAYRDALEYWTDYLDAVGSSPSLLADRAIEDDGALEASFEGVLPAEAVVAAQRAAAEIGVSLFVYFYSVCIVLIARMTGSQRPCTTFQSHGRRLFDNAANVIGSFSNALTVAPALHETMSFAEFARVVARDVRAAIAHETCPYHHVIQATNVHPRFGINWYPALPDLSAEGLDVSGPDMSDWQSDYDLNIHFLRSGESLDLLIYYRPTEIGRDRIEAISRGIIAAAQAFASSLDDPIASVKSASFAPAGLLPAWEAALPASKGEPIHAAFLRNTAERPDAPAIVFQDTTYSYADVEARSRTLALQLARSGFGKGARFAVLADREPSLIWTMLAVSRIGGVFIVLDSAYPEQRLAALADICAPDAILCHSSGSARGVAERLAAGRNIPFRKTDVDPQGTASEDGLPAAPADPEAPAYFLFTSGSTGAPKCVACTHVPLTHFVNWQAQSFGLTPEDRFTMLSGLSHDPLMRDIFTPLAIGATILIPEQSTIFEPGQLGAWFRRVQPTVAHMTPPMAQILTAGAKRHGVLDGLRHVFLGGDTLRPALATEIRNIAPTVQITNFYGSTETPQAAGFFRWDGNADWTALPIGKGSGGYQLAIVNAERQLMGIGEVGEIAVRSNLLSLGYVEKGQIDRYPGDRGTDASGNRNIYFTGDRGYFLPDGNIAIAGRGDDQIKVRGYRVDLSEVTDALSRLPGVRSAIALATGDGSERRIAAFVTGNFEADAPQNLVPALGRHLPGYMLPERIESLDDMPLLPNGKIDRKRLEALIAERPSSAETAPVPANATEADIVGAWSLLLNRANMSPDMSFAQLGGDSLSYVQVYLATEDVIGTMPDGWQFMSIRQLATHKNSGSARWASVDTSMVIRAVSIVLVVAAHYRLVDYTGGATSALFLISGFLFGGFQMSEVFSSGRGGPILRLFGRVLVPTVLISSLFYFGKMALGKSPHISTLLLYSNFVSPFVVGNDFYLWFVDCMLQILLVTWLCFEIARILFSEHLNRRNFAYGLFFLACALKLIVPGLLFPGFYKSIPGDHDVVNYIVTTHWATFMLGAAIATAQDARHKTLLLPLILGYAGLTAFFFYSIAWVFVIAGALALLFVSRIPVWKPLSRVVFALSGASLFIYLTHIKYFALYQVVGLRQWPLAEVAFALAGGVVTWIVWQRLWVYATSRLGRRRPQRLEQGLVME